MGPRKVDMVSKRYHLGGHMGSRRRTVAEIVGLTLAIFGYLVSPTRAITAALCVKNTLKGSIKLRADTPCRSSEIQIGSFDGATIQFSGVNVQIVSGAGTT